MQKDDDEDNSTPMDNMEEVTMTLDVESNAEAGGDAEEFKSSATEDEGEYQTKEFQEEISPPAIESTENVVVSTKKRNTIRHFPPPTEFHLSIRDEELLRNR